MDEKMTKNKKSKRKKDGTDKKKDKELLDEMARAENEGFSMGLNLLDYKKRKKVTGTIKVPGTFNL